MPVFAKSSGKVKISIKAKDLVLKSWDADVSKGISYVDYNGEIDEKIVQDFEKQLNERKKRKPEDKSIKVKKADNVKYYLMPGKYSVVFEKGGEEVEKTLELTERRRR
jgi:hypothetical protein